MGFNAVNFIINTVSVLAANSAQNNKNGAVQSGAQTAQSSLAASSGSTVSSYNSNYSSTLYSALSTANQTTISTVEVEQQANYIKDLLNLPRDFQNLISQIQTQNPNAQALKELSKLLADGKINLNALANLLGENSKAASQKLMMTIMTVSKMGANNVNQLKELMGLLSGTTTAADTAQTVKNLLMLYLPWLPLSIRNSMNLELEIAIFDKINGGGGEDEGACEIIKIMIQTANYGNVMATLELGQNNEIEVFISAIESFPENEVLKAFSKENKKTDIKTRVTIEKNKDPEKSEKLAQNFQITSSNYVSPKLLLAAHSLIKIIIEVDSKEFIINEETEN